jgi:hypothetical protein
MVSMISSGASMVGYSWGTRSWRAGRSAWTHATQARFDLALADQLEGAASAWPAERHDMIRALVTDFPGQSAGLIRSLMYRLMKLPEPAEAAQTLPVPAPRPFVASETFGGQW